MKKRAHKNSNLLAALLTATMVAAIALGMTACSSGAKNRKYTTRYFNMTVPGNYVLNEDKKDGESICEMYFKDSTTYETNRTMFFKITVQKEPASEFRYRERWRVDLQKYSQGELPTTMIGGLPFVEGSTLPSKDNYYLCRDEKSGTSITIAHSREGLFADEILKNINFTLPDLGQTDPLYSWETPMRQIEDKANQIGRFKIETHQMEFSERIFCNGSADNAAYHGAASQNYLYTVNMGSDPYLLSIYKIKNDVLEFVDTLDLPEDSDINTRPIVDSVSYESMGAFKDGILLMEKDAASGKTTIIPLMYGVAVSYDQKLVLGTDPTAGLLIRLGFEDGRDGSHYCTTKEAFELQAPTTASVFDGMVYATEHYVITQTIKDNQVYVFDHEGNFLMKLAGGYSYAYNFFEVNGCIVGLFNYPARLVMWDEHGTLLGNVAQDELLGLPLSNRESDEQPISLALVEKHPAADGSAESAEFILLIGYTDEDGIAETLPFRITITG
ncbi:MAG: hypothetical protein J5752_11480 [Clostridiales bacterium]|nr:hypothetical protein [Clostridiales bacterium]